MTWTSVALSALGTAARTADRPWLLGSCIGDGMRPIWTSNTGAHTDTDESAAAGPAVYAVDRSGARETYPGGITDTEWVLSFGPLPSDAAGAIGIDRLVLLSNLATLAIPGGVQVYVEGATNAAYSAGLETLHTCTPTRDRWSDPFAEIWFGEAGDYLRLRFVASQVFRPRVREAWMGRTRQLRGQMLAGRDPFAATSRLDVSGAGLSAAAARARSAGGVAVPMALRLSDQESSHTDTFAVRSWWRDCDRGAQPFVFSAQPATAQHEARLMTTDETQLALPRGAGPYEVVFEQSWRETPPYVAEE